MFFLQAPLLLVAALRHRLTLDGRLEATVDPGNHRIVIDPRSDSMEYGDHHVRIEREFIRFEAPELYVGSERLGDLLDLMFVVDWSDLTATVVDPSSLPIARRLRREAARDAYLRRPDAMHADVTLGLQRPSWDGVVLDYSLFSPSTDPVAGSTYAVGLGADVGGGSLEMLGQSVGPAELGRMHVDASWTGVWWENRLVRQLHLGDVPSSGPRSRALEGLAVTNAPFVRPSLIGSLRYAGSLEPGWSVEAYRGGELVAFDSANASGGFSIDLPVRYGENPVDFVAYGPFGEIREFNRTYRVLAELLPARRFEYGLSGGRCPQPSFTCNATGNVDLRYGASRRWTVQGGLDQFWRDSLPDRTHPYAALVGNPSNAWAIQTELVGAGLARGALKYEPSVDLRFEGEYVHFAHDSASVLAVPGLQNQVTLSGFWRPATSHGFFFFDGRFERIQSDAGVLTRTRLGASLQTDEVRLLPYFRTEQGVAAGNREFGHVDVHDAAAPVGGSSQPDVASHHHGNRTPGRPGVLVGVRGPPDRAGDPARGRGSLAARRRRAHVHRHDHIVLLGPARRHVGLCAPGAAGRRDAVLAGIGPVGPPHRPPRCRARPVARARGTLRPRIHGSERQRNPRCRRAGGRERARSGRVTVGAVRLQRSVSCLGSRAVRARDRQPRLALARVTAARAVVCAYQRRPRSQPVSES